MSAELRITVRANTNKVGSECSTTFDIDKEEWEAMDMKDKEERCQYVLWTLVDWTFDSDELFEAEAYND